VPQLASVGGAVRSSVGEDLGTLDWTKMDADEDGRLVCSTFACFVASPSAHGVAPKGIVLLLRTARELAMALAAANCKHCGSASFRVTASAFCVTFGTSNAHRRPSTPEAAKASRHAGGGRSRSRWAKKADKEHTVRSRLSCILVLKNPGVDPGSASSVCETLNSRTAPSRKQVVFGELAPEPPSLSSLVSSCRLRLRPMSQPGWGEQVLASFSELHLLTAQSFRRSDTYGCRCFDYRERKRFGSTYALCVTKFAVLR